MKPLLALAAVWLSAELAVAGWAPGDAHSMHYPQLPDPSGWDICLRTAGLSSSFWDDWLCTSPDVTGIEFWVSFEGYDSSDPPPLPVLTVGFDENVPAAPPDVPYARPGDRIKHWSFDAGSPEVTIRHAGSGVQGWHDPKPQTYYTNESDHTEYFQVSVDLTGRTPFHPTVGTTYWLYVDTAATDPQMGWKTSGSDHFGANAVWGYGSGYRYELTDPLTGGPLDMAFVITSEPIPEPGTFALTSAGIAGLVGLAFGRRRRSWPR